MQNLTPDEAAAVAKLRRLEASWPDSLWLFAASNKLHVMRKVSGVHLVTQEGGMDPAAVVAVIDIDTDGGDW